LRGWALQQGLKIELSARLDARAVLIADSDVVLLKPVDLAAFGAHDEVPLYRLDNAVHAGMPRHVRWHEVARRLLGLRAPKGLPLHDYVSSFNLWDPAILRMMQQRIEQVTGNPWLDAFTSHLHLSEFVLYGVYVDEIRRAGVGGPTWHGLCHDYWDHTPLTSQSGREFVDRRSAATLAMMVSAKSHTPVAVRQEMLGRVRPAATLRCAACGSPEAIPNLDARQETGLP